jgi:tight adherence protein B
VEERVQALTAMGRMQGRVMTLLPFAIAAMLYLQQPALMSRLFTEPMGLAVVALAGIMMGLAAWSIRRIVSIDI